MFKAPLAVLAAVAATGALAAPGPAAAAGSSVTFCVHAPVCPPGGIDKGDDLKGAIQASNNGAIGSATIVLGDKGSAYDGPFVFGKSAPNVAPAFVKLTIRAAGAGRPQLTAPTGDTVLSGRGVQLEGIDVRLNDPADGVGLSLNDANVDDVTVSAPKRAATGGTGVQLAGDVDIDGLRLKDAGETSLQTSGAGDITARNLRIDTENVGVAGRDGSLRITESRINAGTVGVFYGSGGLVVDHSAVTTSGPRSFGIDVADGGLTLDHDTVAHRGRPGGDDSAVRVSIIDGLPTRANVRNSALAGYTRGFVLNPETGDTINADVTDSVWDPSRDVFGGSGPLHETGNSHVAPALVDLASGDLRPRGGSALIDRDSKTDGRFRDLDLQPAVDGDGNGSVKADAGAFEYRRQAPQFDSTDVPAGGPTGAPLAFAGAASDADGDRTTIAWAFGDGDAASGARVTHTYGMPGVRTVTATLTDEAGVSATRTFNVAIAASGSPAGGGGSGQGGSAGGSAQAPAGGPERDSTAPTLSALKLSAKRARIAKAKGVKVQFSIDEPATVSIVAKRGKRSGKVVLPAGKGLDKLKLAGAIKKLGKLKPGTVSVTVVATDAAGNRSAPKLLKLKLSR